MISSLYTAYRRAARARAQRLARPVISIGNISMGGRGKTPLAALVAQILADAGERPSVLSRGYGREIADPGVTIVSDGVSGAPLADLAHAGDEPLMLARAVPRAAVLVCESRALAGTLAERALGCTVHVLDDGFQHHQLARDVDIVLVTADDLRGRPLPIGSLREPIDVLADADAVVGEGKEVGTLFYKSPFVKKSPDLFVLTRAIAPARDDEPVLAVAGIAAPERFFDALRAAGFNVAASLAFADHHRYAAPDAARIRAAAAGAAAIVTTSKDVVRLERFSDWPVPLVEVPLTVSVEPADGFRAWLLQRVADARR